LAVPQARMNVLVKSLNTGAGMKTYTLTETRDRPDEIFDRATIEPILVTDRQRPSLVIISAAVYEKLIARLEELEDKSLGKMALKAQINSQMVGVEKFTAALNRLANGEA
jgi:PHD/YefM family antitoxin component YafN of YafNO toxin-antitoxin module